jgi:hypothetical protein
MSKKRKRVVLAGETEPEPEECQSPPTVELSLSEKAKRLPLSERMRYETTERIFLTILSRISDETVSRDLTDKIMMKYHLFKDSPEEEDRLIREEIDKYDAKLSSETVDAFYSLVGELENTEDMPDEPGASLKTKRSKKRKKRKTKHRKTKRKVSKRKVSKRKKKKTKRR